ncbi:MAG: hypothetical protein L3J14_07620 [Flavobacteriaceae bacterium]|nr:hypothetical protein [Flavobacteriaceae bacterium]
MKRIHFDNMKDKKMIAILAISITCLLLVLFFEFKNPKIYKYLSVLGFSLQVIYLSKMFWYKNYVQWNKKGMNIRIKYFVGKSIRFNEVKTTILDDKTLTITKKDRSKIHIDLSNIEHEDVNKLNEIIKNYSFV